MTNLDLTTVRIQTKDLKRLDSEKLKLHKTEPKWSVLERAINHLAMYERKIRSDSDNGDESK